MPTLRRDARRVSRVHCGAVAGRFHHVSLGPRRRVSARALPLAAVTRNEGCS